MRIGPRVQPEPKGNGLPRVAFGIAIGAAVVLFGLLGGPEPEDVARSVAAEAAIPVPETPADVPDVSYWSYRHVERQRDSLRAQVRCLRQAYGQTDFGRAIHECGLEPYGPPGPVGP